MKRTFLALTVGFLAICATLQAAPPAEFSIVVLPDTQFYTRDTNGPGPRVFQSQTDWIVSNRVSRNIAYACQLGDCTDSGGWFEAEWKNATSALYRLENPIATGLRDGIPYGVCVGNHDLAHDGMKYYNRYFGTKRFAGRAYYGGHYGPGNESHYDLFSAGGQDFLALSLKFNAGSETGLMAWADQVLKSNASRRVIITTHSLLNVGNVGEAAPWTPEGQPIFDRLKGHPNVILLLCGHRHGTGRRDEILASGRKIPVLLADYQSLPPHGGNGLMRILTFVPSNGQVRVETYSPWLRTNLTDAAHAFVIDLPSFTAAVRAP